MGFPASRSAAKQPFVFGRLAGATSLKRHPDSPIRRRARLFRTPSRRLCPSNDGAGDGRRLELIAGGDHFGRDFLGDEKRLIGRGRVGGASTRSFLLAGRRQSHRRLGSRGGFFWLGQGASSPLSGARSVQAAAMRHLRGSSFVSVICLLPCAAGHPCDHSRGS